MITEPSLTISLCWRAVRRHARDLSVPSFLSALLMLVWCAGCAAPAGPRQAATVRGYYATTRAVAPNASTPEKAFTATTADERAVRYGRALVEVTSSGSRIVSYDPDLAAGPGLGRGEFNKEVRSQIDPSHPLIVYIHGYNNTFAAAADRAAMFANELQPDAAGSPAIYSWPSASKLFAYAKDEESALLNQENIRRFLTNIHDGDVTTPVVLIGHSLGARAVTYGLRDIFLFRAGHGINAIDPRRPMFAHLVLLEADVNRLYFRANLLRASALCGHITLYVSNRDRALGASRFVHGGYSRLGENSPQRDDDFLGPILSGQVAKKIDIIEASAVRSDLFGHAYDQPVLFEDLRALIRGKTLTEREHHTLEKDPATGIYHLLASPRA
jgi:esterase/lipase superfamily enzyme